MKLLTVPCPKELTNERVSSGLISSFLSRRDISFVSLLNVLSSVGFFVVWLSLELSEFSMMMCVLLKNYFDLAEAER
jgi:hypothetical protein